MENNPHIAPKIHVNGQLIDEAAILAEMQYHPADSHRDSMIQAAQSLIIGQLLKDKAQTYGWPADSEEGCADEKVLLDKLIEQDVQFPSATEEECKKFFEQNRQKFATSPLMEVRHILLAAAPEDDKLRDELRQLAIEMIDTIENSPEAFNSLVKTHSHCPSKETLGSLGQISKGQTVPEFERALFAANEGLLSRPVESRYGLHIVMVDRKVNGKLLPYEHVAKDVKVYLDEKVRRKAIAQYIQTLIKGAEITGFDFKLSDSPLMQ